MDGRWQMEKQVRTQDETHLFNEEVVKEIHVDTALSVALS